MTDTAIALVRSLLGFASAGSVRHVLAPLEVSSVVGSITELAQRTFDRRIAVRTDWAPEGTWVKGDRAQLEQVVMNLLVNSRDSIAGDGQIVVTTRLCSVRGERSRRVRPGPTFSSR